jgi:hypothetical protein
VPRPLDRVAQLEDPPHVDVVPAAERALPDLGPELAVREVLAAGTPFVVGDVALPEVDDLAQRADAGELAEQAFQQGGSAAAEPAEEQNAYQASPLSRFAEYRAVNE